MTKLIKERSDWFLLALVGLALVVFTLHRIISYDIWWQIRTGEWILQNGFSEYEPFNYLTAELPWIEMRWLFSVVAYLVFQGLGLNGLIVLKILLLGLSFFIIGRSYRGQHRWVVILGLTLTLAAAHQRYFIRPELVSYLLLPLFLFCLYRYRETDNVRWLAPLPLLQVVWTNAHTLFVLGPVVVLLFALGEWLGPLVLDRLLLPVPQKLSFSQLRPLFITAILVALACLINPYFVEGALLPVRLFGFIGRDSPVKELIAELRSPFAFAGLNLPFVTYLLISAVSGLGFILNYRRLSPSSLLIWAAFFYLSMTAVRNVGLFSFVAGFIIVQQYGLLAERQEGPQQLWRVAPWVVRGLAALFILVMIPIIVSNLYYRNSDKAFGFGVAVDRFPIRAMAFVRQEGLPLPVLNNMGDGGYLIFEGGAESVYSDGRPEFYGADHIAHAIRLFQTGEGLDGVVRQYGIETIILRHYSDQRLMALLEDGGSWLPVYYDSQYIVYLRDSAETADLVQRLAIDWADPPDMPELERPEWLPPALLSNLFPSVARNREQLLLGELFLFRGNLNRALAYFDEAIALAPVNQTVHFYRGVIFRAQGMEREAAEIFGELDANYLNRGPVQGFAALIYDQAGNGPAALEAYQRAIELGQRTEANYRALIRLAREQAEYATAISALVELATFLPQDAGIWNELGEIYLEVGDNQRARQAFENALAIDEAFAPARENLNALEN